MLWFGSGAGIDLKYDARQILILSFHKELKCQTHSYYVECIRDVRGLQSEKLVTHSTRKRLGEN
ncbi:hypothetical protein BGZ63DRAFT_380863, partial [Mariannaea sp. PMI_226]